MLASLIAERYSKALLQAARTAGALEGVAEQAAGLLQALRKTPEAGPFLASPVAGATAKLGALKAALGAGLHPVFERFLLSVLENKRGAFLQRVLEEFEARWKKASGLTEASLATAHALKPGQLRLLEREMGLRLGRSVQLKPLVQPALLGGAVLRLGDTVYDASLRSQLAKLGRALVQEPIRRAPSRKAKAKKKLKADAKAPAKPKKKAARPLPKTKKR